MSVPHISNDQVVSDRTLSFIIYVLYIMGYFTGLTALIGVIIAHIQSGSDTSYIQSHYRFQIRTFWIGLLYLVIGSILFYVGIGIIILLWWLIWSVVRTIKGILLLNKSQPIKKPTTWGFGG